MEELSGRVAFITGGASGIGFGMARAFSAAGLRIAIADIEAPALEKAASALIDTGAEVVPIVCDVSRADDLRRAAVEVLGAFGSVHVVCNNAGISTGGLVDELDAGDWAWSIGVNLMGVVHGCETFMPILKRQAEGGHFVNTSSLAGILAAGAGWAPYNATKYAVVGLTEVVRMEGREHGIGASVLCPGPVNTNIYAADRNRPDRFGPQVSKVAVDDIREDLAEGLDPVVVGELVLEGIRDDRLHIFTDPRFRRRVQKRFDRMDADFEWAERSAALRRVGAPGANR